MTAAGTGTEVPAVAPVRPHEMRAVVGASGGVAGRIGFLDIERINAAVTEAVSGGCPGSLEDVREVDSWARAHGREQIARAR